MSKNGGKPELVGLLGSAWTLKARWALKSQEVKYNFIPYSPIFGAYWLRYKSGKWSGQLTTPILFTPNDGVLFESFDIAQWADDHGNTASTPSLFPADKVEDIRRWNEASDTALYFARAQVYKLLAQNRAARVSLLPPFMKALGPLADAVSSWMLWQFSSKYADTTSTASIDKTRAVLKSLRAAIEENNGYVLGSFTYADITMAVAVQVVAPVGPPFTKLSDDRREDLTNHELQAEFGDLLTWRDAIFQKHFPKCASVLAAAAV
ncbi:g5022 [Coccomyxa elongata]